MFVRRRSVLCGLAFLSGFLALAATPSAISQTATYLDSFDMPVPFGDVMPSYPYGVCIDSLTGLVYVSDNQFTHSRVVRFSAEGVADQVFGSQGTGNGQFKNPTGIAVNGAANRVYVSDNSNNRVEIFDTTGGWISTLTNPNGDTGQAIGLPQGVGVFLRTGFVYVGEGNRVQRLTTEGLYQSQWGRGGSGDGQFGFFGPIGMASNPSTGQVYVADYSNHRVQRFDSGGVFQLTFGANGSGEGQFSGPRFVAVDSAGHVYVTDTGNSRVQRFTTAGVFEFAFGTGGSGAGQFNVPQGIAVSAAGIVYVADSFNGRIQRWRITEKASPVSAAPQLVISGKKKVVVTRAKVTIKGSVAGSVTSVTYRVGSKGAFKTAAGTTTWKINAALKVGRNTISIVAHGPGGDSAPAKVIVTRK